MTALLHVLGYAAGFVLGLAAGIGALAGVGRIGAAIRRRARRRTHSRDGRPLRPYQDWKDGW